MQCQRKQFLIVNHSKTQQSTTNYYAKTRVNEQYPIISYPMAGDGKV